MIEFVIFIILAAVIESIVADVCKSHDYEGTAATRDMTAEYLNMQNQQEQINEQDRLFQEQVQREQNRLFQEQVQRDQEEQQRQMDFQNQMIQQQFMNQMNNPFF